VDDIQAAASLLTKFERQPLINEFHLCSRVRAPNLRNNMEGQLNVCRRLNFDDAEIDGAGPSEGSPAARNEHVQITEEEMQRDLSAATLRWNFDFQNEVPLEGRWQWEQVKPSGAPTAEENPSAETEDQPEQ
jgi:hypothetical protein